LEFVMKTAEDEAFDEIERRQGGGFPAKRAMAADKLLEDATRSCNNIDEQRALDALMRKAQPAHCQCPACKDGVLHASDCAVHNGPAYPAGPCDCGVAQNTEREALKLAVDGLEKILHTFAKDGKIVMASMIRNELFAEVNSLLQQAKAALAQPAQEPYDQTALELCNVCGWKTLIPDDGCLNCERAQPAQEHVSTVTATVTSETGNPDVTMSWWHEPPLPVGTPLYTYPPKREWVGLTLDEIEELFQSAAGADEETDIRFARLIEAKLKEKNNG
jgi:hypothetical protein